MSLQREHRAGKMSRGKDRVMSLEEFNRLINHAYKFLGVACPPEVAEFVFKSVDKDADGFITYVEYFKVIELYVCRTGKEVPVESEPPKPKEPQGP